ncbi:MAG: elongation factor P [Gammaproteobacteria bacterium]|jgi:elongation factor P|nr:elongation factor P [Gammaproteobacteria bacterium]MBT4463001.1 elongation factor P [Gammaproteobacteria bacterium]MBT4654576.1 elongation factor P [Gammaproteobacteria bacterium]MBT5117114.1 elongation factor P [Gammaproteobacteria bacterium]MBT5761262.1 elongation factor P [Gammaproteobacteria bacterium]
MADNSSLLRNGNKVLIDNEPYLILDNSFVNPGKGQAFTKVRIRNLLNSKVLEKTIKIGETIYEADVMNTKMQFLYKESDSFFFMNLTSYEQSEVNESILNSNKKWLIDGDECDVTIWNDNVIQVDPPKFVNLTVKSTIDAIKGDTVSSTLKEAVMENGEMIMVPIFIKEGELIRIDTENSEYASRVKS